jgi:hypothetical protein
MQRSGIWKYMPAALLAAALVAGPVVLSAGPVLAQEKAAAATDNVYSGKVVGKSNKAKTISIEVDGKVEMVKFDDNTAGLEHAKENEAAIVQFELRGDDRVATVVKPKLAELPPGVTEIQPEELAALVDLGLEKGNYFLVDSRPGPRYAEGHVPTAISLPVPKLKKTGTAYLPGDAKLKNTLMVFYCGGPT